MPKNLPVKCKRCGKGHKEGVRVSRRGLCPECALANVIEAAQRSQETGRVGGYTKAANREGRATEGGPPTP